MIDINRHEPFPEPRHRYKVQVGHCRVTVEGDSPEEAILAARRMLGQDLPRLFDVISTLDAARFEVTRIDEHAS